MFLPLQVPVVFELTKEFAIRLKTILLRLLTVSSCYFAAELLRALLVDVLVQMVVANLEAIIQMYFSGLGVV